jgi:hypothetical protein
VRMSHILRLVKMLDIVVLLLPLIKTIQGLFSFFD